MLKIVFNQDGSIKAFEFPSYVIQGSQNVNKIVVAIDNDTFAGKTVLAKFMLPNGDTNSLSFNLANQEFSILGVTYNGIGVYLTQQQTYYAGTLLVSIEVLSTAAQTILYTYQCKVTINPSTFNPDAISDSQYEQLWTAYNWLYDHAATTDSYYTKTESDAKYEVLSNKVTSLSNLSTDSQYPSAKCVWDNLQNVREVAEGKTKSITVSITAPMLPTTDGQARTFSKPDGTHFATLSAFNDYIGGYSAGNAIFNSSNSSIGIGGNNYFITTDKVVYAPEEVAGVIIDPIAHYLKTGDVIYVVEGSVPDRWVDFVTLRALDAKTDLSGYSTTAQSDARYVLKKTTGGIYAYTHTGSTDGEIVVSRDATESSIVRRGTDGSILLPITQSLDIQSATSKDYVDSAISAASIAGSSFDNVPTENSNNAVKSGGVYSAIQAVKRPALYEHVIQIKTQSLGFGGIIVIDIISQQSTAISSYSDLISFLEADNRYLLYMAFNIRHYCIPAKGHLYVSSAYYSVVYCELTHNNSTSQTNLEFSTCKTNDVEASALSFSINSSTTATYSDKVTQLN